MNIKGLKSRCGMSISAVFALLATSFVSTHADPVGISDFAMERIMAPAEQLPDSCRLAERGGFPYGPAESNPVMTRDSRQIGALAGFALGMSDVEFMTRMAAERDFEASKRLWEEWMHEQGGRFEAAYVAMYRGQDTKTIGVWAFPYKQGIELQRIEGPVTFGKNARRIPNESMLIVAWADSEDRACFDAVRMFLEKI